MKNSNMPAMPQDGDLFCERIGHCPTLGTGLTKREHFAAMAMQGIVANDFETYQATSWAEDIAREAVLLADALLEALENSEAL